MSSGGRLVQPTNIVAPGPAAHRAAGRERPQPADRRRRAAEPEPRPDPVRPRRPAARRPRTRFGAATPATGLIGVMSYTWAGNARAGTPTGCARSTRSAAACRTSSRQPAAGRPAGRRRPVKVAGMNLLNFFNTFAPTAAPADVGGAQRTAAAPTSRRVRPAVAEDRRAIIGTGGDVIGISEIENDGYGPNSAIQFLVDTLNEATAPGTYAFIDADAGDRAGERARHRRDQGRAPLQAGEGDAGRHDRGAELRRLRQRRRRGRATGPRSRRHSRERHRRPVRRRRQPPQEQGQRVRRPGRR